MEQLQNDLVATVQWGVVTTEQLSRLLGKSKQSISQMCHKGELPYYQKESTEPGKVKGFQRYFDLEEVKKALLANKTKSDAEIQEEASRRLHGNKR